MEPNDNVSETTQPSPSEELVGGIVPTPADLVDVIRLSGHVARLEQELELSRLQLRDAWARVPFDPSVLRKPYRADVTATCRVCGKGTTWRTARGLVEHPVCPVLVTRKRETVSSDVFDILLGLTGDDNDESLDDD